MIVNRPPLDSGFIDSSKPPSEPKIAAQNPLDPPAETTIKGYPIFRLPITSTSRRNGREPRFPLDDLEVGQCFRISTEKDAYAARSAAYVMKRKGSEKRFTVTGQVDHQSRKITSWIAQRIA